jgi:hypothetical protein
MAAHGLLLGFGSSYCNYFCMQSGKGGSIKLLAGVLAFSVIVVIISALITKRRDKMDAAEIATYVVIIAWGSLLWGLFLSKCAR